MYLPTYQADLDFGIQLSPTPRSSIPTNTNQPATCFPSSFQDTSEVLMAEWTAPSWSAARDVEMPDAYPQVLPVQVAVDRDVEMTDAPPIEAPDLGTVAPDANGATLVTFPALPPSPPTSEPSSDEMVVDSASMASTPPRRPSTPESAPPSPPPRPENPDQAPALPAQAPPRTPDAASGSSHHAPSAPAKCRLVAGRWPGLDATIHSPGAPAHLAFEGRHPAPPAPPASPAPPAPPQTLPFPSLPQGGRVSTVTYHIEYPDADSAGFDKSRADQRGSR